MGCSSSTLCASLNLKGELFQTKYLRSVGEFEIGEPEISDLNNVLEGHNYVKIKAFDPPKKNENSGEIMQTSKKTKAGTLERPSSSDVSISLNGAELSYRSTLNSPGIKYEAKKLDNSKKSEYKNNLKEMTSQNFGTFFTFKKQVTNSEQKFFEDNFFIEKIGKGGGGEVYKLLHKPSNQFRVAKIVGCIKDPTEARVKKLNKRLAHEANLVSDLDHPNIVKVYEILQDETKAAFVMEYVKGEDLFNNLNNPVLQNNQTVANIMEQIFSALSYLHNKGITHKDIKLQNIMLEEQDPCSIKLIDFGFSEFVDNLTTNKVTGTIGYMSPETLQNQEETKSDLWSAGVLLYTFLFKRLPFPGGSYDDMAENIFNLNLDILLREKQNICSDPLVLQLLKRLLNRDVNQRYSAAEALNDPFIRKYVSKYKIDSSDIELLRTYQQKSTMELVMSSIYVHQLMPNSERLKFNRVFRALDTTHKGFITNGDLNALDSPIVLEKEILQSTPQGVEITNFIIACVDINNPQTLRTLFVYFDKTNCFTVKMNDVLISLENHIHKYAAEEIQRYFKSQNEHELSYEEFKKMIKSF